MTTTNDVGWPHVLVWAFMALGACSDLGNRPTGEADVGAPRAGDAGSDDARDDDGASAPDDARVEEIDAQAALDAGTDAADHDEGVLDVGPVDAGSPFVDSGPIDPGFTDPVACGRRCPTLVAGRSHSCVVREGAPWCWGRNWSGQLGDGTTEQRLGAVHATVVADPVRSIAAGAGAERTCVLDTTGNVRCWGRLGSGAFTDSPVLPPARVPLDEPAVQIVSQRRTCALGVSGSVWCWGYGLETWSAGEWTFDASPVRVADIEDAVTIAVGDTHACAATEGGTVRCWGYSADGNLGLESYGAHSIPVAIAGLENVLDVAVGSASSCALLASGAVSCWGSASLGALGDGTELRWRHTVAEVPGIAGAVAITGAGYRYCALLGSGAVTCWGSAGSPTGTPVLIEGLDDAIEVSAGDEHVCAVRSGGEVVCWGTRLEQRLGDGVPEDRDDAVAALGITDAVQVTAAGSSTCALHEDGTASCWGSNLWGEIGAPPSATYPSAEIAPVVVPGLSHAVELSMGSYDYVESDELGEWSIHTCARLDDGSVSCWGGNWNGELGGTPDPGRPSPLPVPGVTNARALSAGGAHSCIVGAPGNVTCWGSDLGERLGNTTLASWRGVRAIDAGDEGTLAALADGSVVSWGRIYDGLHFYDAWRSATPVVMPGVPAVIDVAWPNCVLTEGGRVWCWSDYYYPFEDDALPVPVEVAGFDDVVEIRKSGRGLCARRGDGAVVCDWSIDGAPMSVPGVADAVSLAAGREHACAVVRSGEVLCWGSNRYGQLGDGTGGPTSETPVRVVGLP